LYSFSKNAKKGILQKYNIERVFQYFGGANAPPLLVSKDLITISLRQLHPPQSPGEGLPVMNFVHCSHILLVIGKYTDVFRGDFFLAVGRGGEGYVGGSFQG
jgi:hypothetical protein